MTSSSSVVKTTGKTWGFAPVCPQLQFQAVGQEHRRGGTVIHYVLPVLKCLGFIIIQDSKEIVIKIPGDGAKRLGVTSESSQNVPPKHKEKSPRSQFLNSPHTDTPIERLFLFR